MQLLNLSFPRRAAALLGAALLPLSAQASGPGGPGEQGSAWGLGLGAISTQKPYKGMDRESKAAPMLYFENDWLRVFGPGLELKLPGVDIDAKQRIEFSLLTRFDGSGYKPKDSTFFNGMAKRKSGLWVGGKASWKNEVADLTFEGPPMLPAPARASASSSGWKGISG